MRSQALPIFLDRLVDPVSAVVLSVTVVLFFGKSVQLLHMGSGYVCWTSSTLSCYMLGEIVPQAICTHYGLAVGAWTAWLVRILMWATCPISWPISKLLDYLLGSEHTVRDAAGA